MKKQMSESEKKEWDEDRRRKQAQAEENSYRYPCGIQIELKKRICSSQSEEEEYNRELMRLVAIRSYFRRCHSRPMTTTSHTCNDLCQWWSLDPNSDIRICLATGNLHHCTAVTCDRLVVRSDSRICELTGLQYPAELQLFAYEPDVQSVSGTNHEEVAVVVEGEETATTTAPPEAVNDEKNESQWETEITAEIEAVVPTVTSAPAPTTRKRGYSELVTAAPKQKKKGTKKKPTSSRTGAASYMPPEQLMKQASQMAKRWWKYGNPSHAMLEKIGITCYRLWGFIDKLSVSNTNNKRNTNSSKYNYDVHCRVVLSLMSKSSINGAGGVLQIPHIPMLSVPVDESHGYTKRSTLTKPTRTLRAALDHLPLSFWGSLFF